MVRQACQQAAKLGGVVRVGALISHPVGGHVSLL